MSIKTIFYTSLLVFALYALFTVGFPFLLAFVLALSLEPIIKYFSQKTTLNRTLSVFFVCTLFTFLFIWISYLAAVTISYEAVGLAKSMLRFTKDLSAGIDNINNQFNYLFGSMPLEYQANLQNIFSDIIHAIRGLIGSLTQVSLKTLTKIPHFFLQTLIFFIAVYLFSFSLPHMKKEFLEFFDREDHSRIETILFRLHRSTFGFIRAQLIISCCVFVVVLAGFLLLGIKYSSALALLVTIVDILPVLGTGTVMLPMSIFYLLMGSYYHGIGIFVHYIIITAFRKIIEPKILAESIGIGPLSALISMWIGFQLTGLIGIFLGPAIIIVFQALIKENILQIKIKFDK